MVENQRNYGMNVILCQVRENYMDFSTIKLRRKRYVERALIFRSAKLHQKSTWK